MLQACGRVHACQERLVNRLDKAILEQRMVHSGHHW